MRWDDLEMVLEWRNHPKVRSFMFTQHVIGLNEHTEWFSRASEDENRTLLVVENQFMPIGFVQFENIKNSDVINWGFYAAPNGKKGSGFALGTTALDYAFNVLGLHKVCGQAIESNYASISFHKKLGFREEGILRDQQYLNGEHKSIFCFGLLSNEWKLIKEGSYAENTN